MIKLGKSYKLEESNQIDLLESEEIECNCLKCFQMNEKYKLLRTMLIVGAFIPIALIVVIGFCVYLMYFVEMEFDAENGSSERNGYNLDCGSIYNFDCDRDGHCSVSNSSSSRSKLDELVVFKRYRSHRKLLKKYARLIQVSVVIVLIELVVVFFVVLLVNYSSVNYNHFFSLNLNRDNIH
ncbi:uncharacterized protein ASCRUDRAFT_68121 [Ascoidea rubescens DSM 1968]|uniref:Uncharacterized protein n=1 Tax=Ascoidea rubescens DSM 1968 TaxID=1344418 RepID=A0A1D2VRA8_9ASCO|nr:hypothetical protein ASCRUDRAFT_68121 [Ascoidea rubescens DSM 1968]ODV64097.1 hypothetical protein ASCRUDRAFT_68121 [Ascoidea rubescens DSM 1968]